MLRVNRIYGADDRLAIGTEFARCFAGGAARRSADTSQITRWETGRQTVSHDVIRRYEQLLSLPSRRLTAVAERTHREAFPAIPVPRREPAGPPTADGALLADKALSGAPLTGEEWDVLTAGPDIGRQRAERRTLLVQRLLSEMIIADGTQWRLRDEALARLLHRARMTPAVVAACGELIRDPSNPIVFEPLTVLEATSHPDAAAQVLRAVTSPVSERAHAAAWGSAAVKARAGHLNGTDLDMLRRRAVIIVTAAITGAGPAVAAAAGFLRAAGVDPAGLSPALDAARTESAHAPAAPGPDRSRVGRLVMRALSRMPRDKLDDDPMLVTLLTEMLYAPSVTTRATARQLIEATPYRAILGHDLATEVRYHRLDAEPEYAESTLLAIGALADPEDRPVIERLCVDPSVPPALTSAASWALAHARGTSTAAFWAAATDRHRAPQSTLPAAGLRGLVYAAGIRREMRFLGSVAADRSLPWDGRQAAAWWLRQETHVLASTRR